MSQLRDMSQLGTAKFKNKKNQVTCSRSHSSWKAVAASERGNEALQFALRPITQNYSQNQGPSSSHLCWALSNSWIHSCAPPQQSLSTNPLLQKKYTGSSGVAGLCPRPLFKNLPSPPHRPPFFQNKCPQGSCYSGASLSEFTLYPLSTSSLLTLHPQPTSLF